MSRAVTLSRTVMDDQTTTDFCFGLQQVLWPVYFSQDEVWDLHEVTQSRNGSYMCITCGADLDELIAMWDEEPEEIE